MIADIKNQIESVIEKRSEHLSIINAKLRQAKEVDNRLRELNNALTALAQHPTATDELRTCLSDFQKHTFYGAIANSIQQLTNVQTRLSRKTINIGVSGQARTGKSTLLQTITGLPDEIIPTGKGIPVTAVRCRFLHSTTHSRATLTLHSFETFRDEMLKPYHKELGFLSYPLTLEEFKTFDYKNSLQDQAPSSHLTLLERLRKIQQAIPSYETYLTGGRREEPLQTLRPWIAYPTNEEEDNPNCERLYLAVKEALIECAFQATDVEGLILIDLPGLGELDAESERRHVDRLKNEVDLVLLIKRSIEGFAYWRDEDGKAANLLDEVRGAITQRRDFVTIVVNSGVDDDKELLKNLLDDIKRKVNEGTDNKHYQVLQCDAINSAIVREKLVMPCLEHLAERLPIMDREVVKSAQAEWHSTIQKIQQALKDLKEGVKKHAPEAHGTQEKLNNMVEDLRERLGESLAGIVKELLKKARLQEEDTQFIEAVEKTSDDINKWVDEEGFGRGLETWKEKTLRKITTDNGPSQFIGDELNRIRVHLSEAYCEIDRELDIKVNELWTEISRSIRCLTGKLLEDTQDGREALENLADCLENANEPCPVMSRALRNLLSLKISYKSHFFPRVREKLDPVNQQIYDYETNTIFYPIAKEDISISPEGVEILFTEMSNLATKASYETQKALLAESLIPTLILHAAAEQFDDSLIRSGESKQEFARLGRSYRDEIWPGEFEHIDAQNARVVKVRRTIDSLEKLLNNSIQN